ncbi:hypothetical protein [Nocardia macrotermitis]|uniref:Uncharacterized protein n=1 Tax=Nocardia macrotermitis TaxID=2585198 RepID=A0A7K0D1E2_9NOCA|nr:hypothetical protein [Nocardia macrotermitis]MQY19052.1 hypothetical protein [Nocardia macrotermitis]
MRRASGLRRRPITPRSAKPASKTTSDGVDPPIIARLVQPMLQLRASLGTGVSVPDANIVRALTNSSSQAADTEAPHRDGMHALEATWSGPGANAAVPALRTTQTQIGDISDRGPQYLSVLNDAQSTSYRAAQKVDAIIADFRSDARTILNNAKAAPDTDAVIARASQALREVITAVDTAKTEMASHTTKLQSMGPLTVTTPVDLSTSKYSGDSTASYDNTDNSTSNSDYNPSRNFSSNNSYNPLGTGTSFNNNGTSFNGTTPAVYMNGANTQIDPATAAQMQLQQQLIAAGVDLGSSAISAGVNIGTELIDKIAEVGTHAIDTGAQVAEQAIPQLINPKASTDGTTGTDGSSTSKDGANSSVFDFGGSTPTSAQPADNSNSIIPDHSGTNSDNSAAGGSTATPGTSIPAPTAKPVPQPATPAPSASEPAPAQSGPTAGLALPPSAGTGSDHKPRDGQLGVTAPAGMQMVPTAVIGDLGDDEI